MMEIRILWKASKMEIGNRNKSTKIFGNILKFQAFSSGGNTAEGFEKTPVVEENQKEDVTIADKYPYLSPLGLISGLMDAIGGGGWVLVETSTLLANGNNPRKTI
ncbi:MAG: hypothetical protein JXA19_02660 [Anaerolineales bacterium]|nr:hypothetical protein [Anaerolineales bacterium]